MPPSRSSSNPGLPAVTIVLTPYPGHQNVSPRSPRPGTPYALTPYPHNTTFLSTSPGRSPLGSPAYLLNPAVEPIVSQRARSNHLDKPIRPIVTKSSHSHTKHVSIASPSLHSPSPSHHSASLNRQHSPRIVSSPYLRRTHLIPASLRMTSIRTSATESSPSPLPPTPMTRFPSHFSSVSPLNTSEKWVKELKKRPAPILIPTLQAGGSSSLWGRRHINSEMTEGEASSTPHDEEGQDTARGSNIARSISPDNGPTAIPLTVRRLGTGWLTAEVPLLRDEPSPGWADFQAISIT
ncbi:hypothetical protein BCR39DRAFT_530669 [Naematelia encephala]|uniref:Uncharacterized protein n=1 Tax=Naematelia encephala TaxID=71784 RepID=A0A1Y2B5A9_9TREE|nr:hypothetical protein BCR39DRAFT_530669 [Naematelia encephala]